MSTVFNTIKVFFKGINPFSRNDENVSVILFVIRKILAFIFVYFASMFIAEAIAIIIHFAMGYNVLKGEMLSMQAMTLMKYYGYIIHIGVIFLYCKIFERRSPKTLGFNKKVTIYLKGILVAVLLLTVCIGLSLLTGAIKYNGIFKSIDFPIILAFMGGFIVQGAMEETMCRGFFMTSLSKKVVIPIAIFISSIAFAWPHFSSLFQADLIYCIIGLANLLLVSAVFALYIINDGNIYVACGLHSFWNFISLNVCRLNLSGISGTDGQSTAIFNLSVNGSCILNGGQYGIESSILTTLVLTICTVLLTLKFKKKGIKKIEF
ncbi:CPBP family intramembrane metalloprotease [Tissierella sp. MSJ-40]|uniref:CPBP family intramembrane metalloprotease n=1 Tax=Tissierella simiarum TaxID=2841534 RepID=A0ABS6E2Q1_9FIRM|nr:type II CAAX endopeptidase family protein [Tissierella simiarum]MBU5436523.1 CPBP family intramembrane metalloprotease [Tissierella simiarum]